MIINTYTGQVLPADMRVNLCESAWLQPSMSTSMHEGEVEDSIEALASILIVCIATDIHINRQLISIFTAGLLRL